MRETTRAIHAGIRVEGGGGAAPLVAEYITRMRLKKLGYVFDPATLSDFKMRAFLVISEELDKIQREELKKK